MFIDNHNRKIVVINSQPHGVLILPIFSLSKPKIGRSRMVFDWGRGLAHPRAKIAFAILNTHVGNWLDRIIYENITYKITDIRKCRSGRMAATIEKMYDVNNYDNNIIRAVLAQELQDSQDTKNTA